MKRREKEESNRAIYKRTWYAWNFLSENDHMDVFDGKIIWLLGFITVSSIVMYIGMILWNLFMPEHQVDGVYVLAASSGLAFLTFVAYLIYIASHNHDVVDSKAVLAETKTLYPKIWDIIQGHAEYSLIPDEIAKMDKLAKCQPDAVDNEPKPTMTEEPVVLALPEEASGLDYSELIKDEKVAQYLEIGKNASNFDELIDGWKKIENKED